MADNIESNAKPKGFLPYNLLGWIWLTSTVATLGILLSIFTAISMRTPVNVDDLLFVSGYIGLCVSLLAVYKTEYLKEPSVKENSFFKNV